VGYDVVIVRDEQPGKRTTLQDVARLAGVSHQTVSRAINDKGEIDPQTRRRVLDAARQLRYRPSRFARGLVRPDTTTIGLVVADVVNPFFPELIAGVLDAAAQRRWQVVVGSYQRHPGREPQLLRSLATQVDALIGFLAEPDDVITAAIGQTPLVVINRHAPHLPIGRVDIDASSGILAAMRHLHARGHRHIGMINCTAGGDPTRKAAFLAGATENGLTVAANAIVDVDGSMAGGEIGLTTLLDKNPDLTAVFAWNDVVALGAHKAARRLGRAIPNDLALVGFDGLDLGELIDPPLTTVYLDKRRMGELAVIQAEQLLDGTDPDPALIATELLIRAST
jgi:LacI family transcriptional regulator